jgi:hypothetical protein
VALVLYLLRDPDAALEGLTFLDDAEAAEALGLRPDTIYRALVELSALGVLAFSRPDPGKRTVLTDRSHWILAAVAATGQQVTQ